MVFSVLSVFVAFGAVIGTSEGIQASQRRARREEHRSRKNNLVVSCPKSSAFAPQLEGRHVVLSGGRLFVDTSASIDPNAPFGHPFAGYFLPYPEARHAGLVSTITDEAPIMNWVFAERESYALCYGPRTASEGNFTGPWDCTRQERRLTFGGWEGFMAVRIPPADESGFAFWALYFDKDGDRLKKKLADWPEGTVAVEVALARRELRTPKPPELTPEQLEELKKKIEAERAKQEGNEVKAEVKSEETKEKKESSERNPEDEKGEEKSNKVEDEQTEEKNEGEPKVRHGEDQQMEMEKKEKTEVDEEKTQQKMENDNIQKEKEQKERKERKREKEKRERERKEKEWRERETEKQEKEEKEEERAKTQKEKEQQNPEQQNRQPGRPRRQSRQRQRQRQRQSAMSATSSTSAQTTEMESSNSSVADDEGGDADDDYTSSVYSMFTDSRRASSSGISVPDVESSSD